MGGLPNHKFPIEKYREGSRLESSIGSLRQRLKRITRGEREIEENLSLRSSFMMPKNKNRQSDFNGYGDESPTGSDQGASSSRGRNGKKGKAPNHYEDTQDEVATSSTKDQSLGVDHFTKVTKDTIQHLKNTEKDLKYLADLYDTHVQDIENASENHQKVLELEDLCSAKDVELNRLTIAFDTIQEVNLKKDTELKKKAAVIEQERKALAEEKDDLENLKERDEKRAKAKEAERQHSQDKEFEKLKASHEQEFKERVGRLESDWKKRDDDRKKEVANLEDDNNSLSKQLEEIEAKNCEHLKALASEKEKYQDMENSRSIFRGKAQQYKEQLDRMRNEFGLGNNTLEHYQTKFAEISDQISSISTRYCNNLDLKEWVTIHEKLKALDFCFASIPISESQDSKLLRIAHVQRIISFHLCSIILQPFSTDSTFQPGRQDVVALLEKAQLGLNQGGYDKRAATVFKALAVRGLQSVQDNSVTSAPSSPNSFTTRSKAFVSAVVRVISLLVPESEHARLEGSLITLANSTISLWSAAQTEELLDISVSLDLDPLLRMKWRSPVFDPENGGPIVSSTHPRIFTLFPTVIAKAESSGIEPGVRIPGSFEEARTEPQVILREFCIHDGFGMAESSALVLRGKEEQMDKEEEEEDKKAEQQIEKARLKREARNKVKSQRTGSTSGPSSPTTSWTNVGGNKKLPEE